MFTPNVSSPQNQIKYVYYAKRIVDAIIDYWQYLLGAVISLIVIFLTFAIFWRCNLFSKVRFYKDDFEEEDVPADTEVENIEVVELRDMS